jgi:phosphatidate cytidylyltransferase
MEFMVLHLLVHSTSSFCTQHRQNCLPHFRKTGSILLTSKSEQTATAKSLRRKKASNNVPKKVVKIIAEYATRLWRETNAEARKYVDSNRVAKSISLVQKLLLMEEEVGASTNLPTYTTIPEPQRLKLLEACNAALLSIGAVTTSDELATIPVLASNQNALPVNGAHVLEKSVPSSSAGPKSKTRSRRSIGFGAAMGLAVTCWVFSGNYIFTGLFTLMTALGQLEYYRMVMNTGVFPARRISVIGACSMFLAALFTPDLHQIVLPMTGIWAMVWFLTMRRTLTPIPEIATTFTGLFYLGYVPSFWVRIRILGMRREPTRLAPIVGPMLKFLARQGNSLPGFIPQVIHLPITTGAIFIFWTWLSLAFSDVGAYFVGRTYGKTKLGSVFPAAGATSPNKTIEGALGGCAVSALLSILGAWIQRWPRPILTGAFHGLCLGLLGLLGDLTASMLKRDAGVKDFGDLLPEHGGVMDRVDSFIWAAPYS